jgi:hypothetical protein
MPRRRAISLEVFGRPRRDQKKGSAGDRGDRTLASPFRSRAWTRGGHFPRGPLTIPALSHSSIHVFASLRMPEWKARCEGRKHQGRNVGSGPRKRKGPPQRATLIIVSRLSVGLSASARYDPNA